MGKFGHRFVFLCPGQQFRLGGLVGSLFSCLVSFGLMPLNVLYKALVFFFYTVVKLVSGGPVQ